MPTHTLDARGLRAYAGYFGLLFAPLFIAGRSLGFTLEWSGPAHITLYTVVLAWASHRLLRRFFDGQNRLTLIVERHRLASYCAVVTSATGTLLTYGAARAGLIAFVMVGSDSPPAELVFFMAPIGFAVDYFLFRFAFSDVIGSALATIWRTRIR